MPRSETVEPGFRAFVARALGEEGRAWLARLPDVTAEVASRWRLELGPELPGGLLACVRAARCADGSPAILKLAAPAPEAAGEPAVLRLWAGGPAPELLDADEALGALLLERVEPGVHPPGADPRALAALLARLHVPVPERPPLPPLADVVRWRVARALANGRASTRKAEWALATLAALERDAPAPAVLHGDLDERNLLVCARRGLCAIDPLPCAGDPAYDAGSWVHGNRRPGRRARLDALVAATGLDRARVRDWAAIVGVHG